MAEGRSAIREILMALVLDTDVLSFLFKKDTRAKQYRQFLHGEDCFLSFMTLAELRAWAIRRRWGQPRQDALARFLRAFEVFYVNESLCQLWAEVVELGRKRGKPVDVADAWIAATALA